VAIKKQGNTGIRRPHVIADEAGTVTASSWNSTVIPLNYCTSGVLTLLWSDFSALDAVAYIQGSYDGVLWNNLERSGCLLDSTDDVQLWEFTSINVLHLRIVLAFNSVTSGAFALQFRGEFNSAKNY